MAETDDYYSFMYSEFTNHDERDSLAYEQKINFWEKKLISYCEARKNPFFYTEEAKETFVYKNLLPIPFNKVVLNLLDRGRIRSQNTLVPLTSPKTSSRHYFFNKLYGLLAVMKPPFKESVCYACVSFLDILVTEIIDRFWSEDSGIPFGNIVVFAVFGNMCFRWGFDFSDKELSSIVAYMQEKGLLVIRHYHDERIIKLTKEPQEIVSEVDVSACFLKSVVYENKEVLLGLRQRLKKTKTRLLALNSSGADNITLKKWLGVVKALGEREASFEDRIFALEQQLYTLHDSLMTSQVANVTSIAVKTIQAHVPSDSHLNSLEEIEFDNLLLQEITEALPKADDSDICESHLQEELHQMIFDESIKKFPEPPTFRPSQMSRSAQERYLCD